MIKKIKKRSGQIVKFDKEKIANAIFKAAEAVGGKDRELAKKLADKVTELVNEKFKDKIPSVEDVQDLVEKVLIEENHSKTAKAYILYRQERKELREAKSLIGVQDDIKLSFNAIEVLERRYLKKDEYGKIIETPKEMFMRVANNIAKADAFYNGNLKETEEEFFNMMVNLEFIPNSPTLMNAGNRLQQLSACFVLEVPDSIDGIFDALKNAAVIHKSGGGVGFSFSRLRPKDSVVASTKGVSSGPISFMTIFDSATETIKQGGTRRGANMGILRVDHPDILDFIVAKERTDKLNNFNISVAITDKFMKAVKEDKDYELIDPHTNKIVKNLNAKKVFDLIVTMAWKNGEPGVIFLDKMNKYNPTPEIGLFESTNPCGEVPILPYESCNLGSINLSKFIKENKIDWNKLKKIVHTTVHFLDNIIDMNKFPLKKIEEVTKGNRKIGLGVMGFADMLIELGILYNSEKAVKTAEEVMRFINEEAKKASCELSKKRGVFLNFNKSIYDTGKKEDKVRNATRTAIAPTGTISIIANCSSGIEPLFAVSYTRRVMEGTELLVTNPLFKKIAKKEGFYSDDLMNKIARQGSIQHIEEIPKSIRKIFVISQEIEPEWHLKIQAAFQKYTDNSVSKTINFPSNATVHDVEKVFLLAYKLGCKGVTVYRYGSREGQVLTIKENKSGENPAECKTCSV